jgi:hypothetical protein
MPEHGQLTTLFILVLFSSSLSSLKHMDYNINKIKSFIKRKKFQTKKKGKKEGKSWRLKSIKDSS